MKARQLGSVFLCSASLVAAGTTMDGLVRTVNARSVHGTVPARQTCRDVGQPYLLIVSFSVPKGQPDSVGVNAADTLRKQTQLQLCGRNAFYPRPTADINRTIADSGYDTTKALSLTDVQLLSPLMSADVVVIGEAAYENRKLVIRPSLMDPNDRRILEPFGEFIGNRPTLAANAVMRELRNVTKLMPEYRKCRSANNESRFNDAIASAKAAMAVYPTSVMARVCMAMAYVGSKAEPAAILSVTEDILKAQPKSWYGLRFAEIAERRRGDTTRANNLLLELFALDPGDIALSEELVVALAAQKDFPKALEVISQAKASNPGQPETARLEAEICFAIQDWSCSIRAFEELGVLDTSQVNGRFFERLVFAHRSSGNLREAANAAGRGATKFADSTKFWTLQAQMLRELGDSAGAIVSARRALAIDRSNTAIVVQIAAAFGSRMDSVVDVVTSALPHVKTAQDTTTLFNVIFSGGQALFDSAKVVPDSAKTEAHWDQWSRSLKYMEVASPIQPTNVYPKFYIAAINFHFGYKELGEAYKLQAADPIKTCALATSAYDRWQKAQNLITSEGAGTASREYAVLMINAMQEAQQTVAGLRTTFCKPGS
jgi:tetratricopeptide (TPR) repeat protein